MLTNPFGTIKSKMAKIDHARFAYEICADQFYENNAFLKRFNLEDNLQVWFNVTALHIWILTAQLKTLGPEGRVMCQEIFSTMLLDIEIRLNKAGVRTRINQITSDLISLYYGQQLAYDEGLALGDAVLASALWRNIFSSSVEITAQDLKHITEYVRLQLQFLDEKNLVDLDKSVKFLDVGFPK
ncbi:hypothetical protein HK100_007856 [Physocladia obscura]|uniref:Ubiquinol-cytochrome c chaperone domain-containing protein n=1 Tax=Physocladia obscura TaxID=109957 RepID=A0AAD5SQY9_9FUNG|nr:hypothetical protein HK100_007856 [Physocladia obscura]